MGLVDTLKAKYDLYRLEQRYTRREKRTTFYSTAQYIDGEYVYTSVNSSPTSEKSSSSFGSGSFAKRLPSVKVAEVFSRGDRRSKVW
jgi:hypothetical protein